MRQSELILGDVLYMVIHKTGKKRENIFKSLAQRGREVRRARYEMFRKVVRK